MKELVFQVEPDEDGGYVARTKLASGSVITQGDTLDELKLMIKDAVSGFFSTNQMNYLKPFGFRLMKFSH